MSDLPRFGLAMIVKDEEARIARCLESLKPHIGWWTISDTGSNDSTIAIIRETLADIPGELIESPFRGMGVNRSEVFAAIRGHCQFFFASDADMEWSIDADFVPDPAVEAYQVEMRSGQWSWRLPLLLSGTAEFRSVGKYHEFTEIPGRPFVGDLTDVVRVSMSLAAPSTPTKLRWQLSLIEADMAEKPDDARSVFYAAQLHRELGDGPNARNLYLRRAGMGGFEEEAWWAAYHAANLAPEWPTRAVELMAAWERRPSRLEPLRDLVRELNNRGSHHAAYALACAADMSPCADMGFTEPAVWAWGLTFERSIAAWWCGYPEETRALSENLLERDDLPADVRVAVERNLALAA